MSSRGQTSSRGETSDDSDAVDGELGQRWDRLWTPHRLAYIRGESKPPDDSAGRACPFCRSPGSPVSPLSPLSPVSPVVNPLDSPGDSPASGAADSPDDNLVVTRGVTVYAVMNLYPYNPGHVLICPYRHVSDYTELTKQEYVELAELTRELMAAIRLASGPAGFNVGLNQGRAGGAGIAAHLHQHLVPRWSGDSNFMTTVAGSRTMAMLLEDSREVIAAALAKTRS